MCLCGTYKYSIPGTAVLIILINQGRSGRMLRGEAHWVRQRETRFQPWMFLCSSVQSTLSSLFHVHKVVWNLGSLGMGISQSLSYTPFSSLPDISSVHCTKEQSNSEEKLALDFLLVQWIGICLPRQVCSLVRGRFHMPWSNEVHAANFWVHALEPSSRNYWVCVLQLLKHSCLVPEAVQQEKTPQWEAHAPDHKE